MNFGTTVTKNLRGHQDVAEAPSFLSSFDSFKIKCRRGKLSIELPKETDPELAERLAELVRKGLEAEGIKTGSDDAAKDFAAHYLGRLVEQCAFLGITDEERFRELMCCDTLPAALGSGKLDFINKYYSLDDVTNAAWEAMRHGPDTVLLQLIPTIGKVDPEGGLDLLAQFCRRYPDKAELPCERLSAKKAKRLQTAIASRAIRLALDERCHLEAGQLLAEARTRKLAPRLVLNEKERALAKACGADPDRMGGGTPCDLLILVLCAPGNRLLQTAWSLYKADVRAGGRPAVECTQALFQSFNKDLLPGESRNALTAARSPRDWGLRFVKLAQDAALDNDFKRLSRYMDYVAALCSCERDLLDGALRAVVELMVGFPNLLKQRKFVRRIKDRLIVRDERQLIGKLDKAVRAAQFGAQLLGTNDWDHGISFEAPAPDAPTRYNSFAHGIRAIALAKGHATDPDPDTLDALGRTIEILTYVIDRAGIDTEKPSQKGRMHVYQLMQALADMVSALEDNPSKDIAARGSELREFIRSSKTLASLLAHAYGDELPAPSDT